MNYNEPSRDFDVEFGALMAGEVFPDTTNALAVQIQNIYDSEMLALDRRRLFLTSFMELYPDSEEGVGYSHRRQLLQNEDLAEASVPDEVAAITRTDSELNEFVSQLVERKEELERVKDKVSPEKFVMNCSAVKIAFASEAAFKYEESVWPLRIVDAAIPEGIVVSTLSRDDIDIEAFLTIGRTAEMRDLYLRLACIIGDRMNGVIGDRLDEALVDIPNTDSVKSVLVAWSIGRAAMEYECQEERGYSAQAKEYLNQSYRNEAQTLADAMERIALENGLPLLELKNKLSPFYALLTEVGKIGILAYSVDDIDSLSHEIRDIIDEWFGTDED